MGIGIGLIGILIIAKPWETEDAALNLTGVVYMLVGSLSLGISFVYAKKYLTNTNIAASALTSYQIFIAIVVLGVFGDLEGMGNIHNSYVASLGIYLGLGLLGTGVAYILYYQIVNNLGAVVASTVTYIPPVISLLIGALLANEQILFIDWGAIIVILFGVYLMNRTNGTSMDRLK